MGSATAPTASKAASRKRHHSLSPEACQTASKLIIEPFLQACVCLHYNKLWGCFSSTYVYLVFMLPTKLQVAGTTQYHSLRPAVHHSVFAHRSVCAAVAVGCVALTLLH